MVSTQKLITADGLLMQQAVDDRAYELVRGELVEMVPAGGMRGIVAAAVGARLSAFVQAQNLGVVFAAETGFLLARDPDTVRAPDAAFLAWGRMPNAADQTGYWPVAPDLAVEVVSPHDRAEMLQARVQDFLAHGTRLVWVIYPESLTATVYRPDGTAHLLERGDALDGGEVLPGLRIPLATLIPEPPTP